MGVTNGLHPLVGRDLEWTAVLRALRATEGGAQIVEVVGEPGIGKTRLLAELVRHARDEGFRTLTGRATEFEHDVPLALVVDALDDHVRHHAEEVTAELDADEVRRLGDILTGLQRTGTGEARLGNGTVERYRCFRALRRLLEVLAAPSSVLVVLDDVHWADPSSVEFLEHLLRHPPAGRVLLALAYRPAQVSTRLAGALAADHSDRIHRIRLAALSEQDVARLLGADVDARQARHLYEVSGGNPLYLDALRRAVTTSSALVPRVDMLEPGLAELPPQVCAALAAEVAAVGALDRLVASAAAVCGYECEPALLATVAQLQLTDVLGSLDELVRRDVVQAVSGTGRFRFRHPVVRHVVYASTAAGWRLGAHGRAAEHLARVGAPLRAQAHHVARCAAAGDTTAAYTLINAAREVGAQAPATAVEWLQTALRLLPEKDPPPGLPGRGELLAHLAGRQAAGGDLAAARQTMTTVLDRLPIGHPERADAVAYTGLLLRMLGDHHQAVSLLATNLDRLPDPACPGSLRLRLQLATYCVTQGELRAADEWLCSAIALGRDTPAALIARAMRAMTGFAAGDPPQDPAPTATMLLDTLDDADIASHIEVFLMVCWTGMYVDGPRESLRRLQRCRRIAVSAGHSFALTYLLSAQALVQSRLAQVTEAQQVAEEATEIARLLGAAEPLALTLLTQCWLQRCAGRYAEAVATGEQAVAAAEASRGWLPLAGAMLGYARISAGDVEAGRTGLIAATGGPDLPYLLPHNRLIACSVLGEAAAAEGDRAAAARWADLAEQVPDPGRGVGPGVAMLVRAYAAGTADPATAARLAERAATGLADAEVLMVAGKGWLLAAACSARLGDPEATARAVTAAAAIYDGSGADALQSQTDRFRRELDGRAGDRTGAVTKHPNGPELTPRETEIAAQIAAGRTNAEIADHFFLSIRTVETHVSRIYTKIGVTTRAAAVSRLARMDGYGWTRTSADGTHRYESVRTRM